MRKESESASAAGKILSYDPGKGFVYMNEILNEGLANNAFKQSSSLDRGKIDDALRSALSKIDKNMKFFTYKFPGSTTQNNVYDFRTTQNENPTKEPVQEGDNFDWTTSFWTGMLWLAYEVTGDPKYRAAAEIHVDSFAERIDNKIDVDTHDLGFLYTLSCVSAYRLTGNEKAKNSALKAADHLMTRYYEKAGIIQAHGDLNDPKLRGRIIIDCLMNLPLLYWATEMTGDESYKSAAYNQLINTIKYIVREDASTYHTYYFNTETGAPKNGDTLQGATDDSCWSRGQAWGIYGCMLSYVYLKEQSFLEISQSLANYFLNRCPEDFVVYWDLVFTDGSGEVKDSSASTIALCGLMELTKWLPEGEIKHYYSNAASSILLSLIDNYSTIHNEHSNALVLHATYFKKRNWGVDEASLFGDYFYLEALVRKTRDWKMYW
jgi:unsaturated chondroitin disaccharide hydrolase